MKRVACTIVTYNRLSLLKECVDSLRNQTCKDFDIIIINNGSTDGTKEWLEEQPDITPINQANVGGAGGFYTGMKTAFEGGYEWVWMMDDDGIADSKQLEKLLDGANECHSKFVNALVCDIKNPNVLSFGLIHDGIGISRVEDARRIPYIINSINPFNGTLIHRDVIATIGLIKKEMFIWGDEREYTFRAQKAGFDEYTVTSAIHNHPAERSQKIRIIPFISRFTVDIPSNKERAYIKYRNNGFLCHTYYPQEEFKEKLKYSLYFILRLKFKDLFSFFKNYNKGKHNIFETK